MVEEFRIGDPVWAKMKGYPPWPAKIVRPPADAKAQNKKFVFFFGTDNFAWISTKNISPHSEQQLLNSVNKKKIAHLQTAIDALLSYSKSYRRKKTNSPKVKIENNEEEKMTNSKIMKSFSKYGRRLFAEKSRLNKPISPRERSKKNKDERKISSSDEKNKDERKPSSSDEKNKDERKPSSSNEKNKDERKPSSSNEKNKDERKPSSSNEENEDDVKMQENEVDVKMEENEDKKKHISLEVTSSVSKKYERQLFADTSCLKKPCLRKKVSEKNKDERKPSFPKVKTEEGKVKMEKDEDKKKPTSLKVTNNVSKYGRRLFVGNSHLKMPSSPKGKGEKNNDERKPSPKVKTEKNEVNMEKTEDKKKPTSLEVINNDDSKKHGTQVFADKFCMKGKTISSSKGKHKKNKDEKPCTKIATDIRSVLNKHEKHVFPDKSLCKGTKRRLEDLSVHASYPSLKSMKFGYKSHVCKVPSHVSHKPFCRNDSDTAVKQIRPSNLRFGFIGLGVMGKYIVKALIESGHDMSVWNRTSKHCDMFVQMGAKQASSPADLILKCDVTFCCVSDPDAIKAIVFGENGVIAGLTKAATLRKFCRGFVSMTNTDPITSIVLARAVKTNLGHYLEAPLFGTSRDAANGTLVILAAGDPITFSRCETCFYAIGKSAIYLNCNYGKAIKMVLLLNLFSGTMCAALAEVMALAERLKLPKEDLLTCLSYESVSSALQEKARMMANESFTRVTTLKHMQKDMNFALVIGNSVSQPMYVTTAANEMYKRAVMRGFSEEDISAVYKVVKF